MSARMKAAAAAVAATFAGESDPLVVTMLATAASMEERTAAVEYLRAILTCVLILCLPPPPLSRSPVLSGTAVTGSRMRCWTRAASSSWHAQALRRRATATGAPLVESGPAWRASATWTGRRLG